MEHLWSILSQNMIVNQETKNTSLIEIIERLTVGFPDEVSDEDSKEKAISFSAVLVTMWMRSELEISEHGQVKVILMGPDQEQIQNVNIEFDVNLETSVRYRVAVKLNAIPYTRDGLYRFGVQQKFDDEWHTVASVPFELLSEVKANIEVS